MEVSYHTRVKHKLLGDYLSIWETAIKGKIPLLQFVDLFAGDGICKLESSLSITWDGSAILGARIVGGVPGWKCILNSWDPNDRTICDRLKHTLGETKPNIQILSEDANLLVGKILSSAFINPNYPSIFFLDPTAHSQLPWSTIEKIGNHRGKINRNDTRLSRRPELIVTLMTVGMQRNPQDLPGISRALGVTEEWLETWIEFWKELPENQGEPINKSFLDLFTLKLERLYGHKPLTMSVHNRMKSIVYWIVFASSHKRGVEIYGRLIPCVEKYHEVEWWKEVGELKILEMKEKMRQKGQQFLDERFSR
ncbi:MAG: three-Cys-motif partner protein TcmP [Euryarchaeota archaeon]|nr:three-Cys-motif partner protein TcmP [Euryarchaeota archaeon]